MNGMKTTVLSTLTLVLLVVGATAAADGDGGYAGSYFQVPVGARPTAMGGAYRAISNDGAAPIYNPAGLAGLKRSLFASSYRVMKLDRQVGYVTLIFPARGNSALGLHWRYAGSGSVEVRNSDGDKLGRELSMSNHDFSIIFAKRFEDFFAAGAKMYYLHSSFAEMRSFSVGFDAGLMFYMDHIIHERGQSEDSPIRDIQVGLTLKYFEAKYIWNNEDYVHRYIDGNSFGTEQEDKIPIEFGLGTSARFLQRKLLLAVDLVKNTEQSADFHGGAEYFVQPEFALRGGFSNGRFTAGTGYVFNLARQVIAIDYAFSTDKEDEGSEHVFSFEFLF
jgi:hypothetical protein